MLLGTRRALLGPWGRYLEKVLLTEPDNLIGCWLQNESVGSVSIDYSGEGNDGAYTGVTLGQAGVPGMRYTSPYFDGANDYNNIYSAGLNTDFSGAEGTLLPWAKVSGAGVWTDGLARYLVHFQADANNRAFIIKSTINNRLDCYYVAGGVFKNVVSVGHTTLEFLPVGITWDIAAGATGEMITYVSGLQIGVTQVGLGTWVGDLAGVSTIIGARTTAPLSVYSGNIGPVALWNKALTADQMAYLSKA